MNSDSEDGFIMNQNPPELRLTAENAVDNLLPTNLKNYTKKHLLI